MWPQVGLCPSRDIESQTSRTWECGSLGNMFFVLLKLRRGHWHRQGDYVLIKRGNSERVCCVQDGIRLPETRKRREPGDGWDQMSPCPQMSSSDNISPLDFCLQQCWNNTLLSCVTQPVLLFTAALGNRATCKLCAVLRQLF